MAILAAQYNPLERRLYQIEFEIVGINQFKTSHSVGSVSFRVGKKRIDCFLIPDAQRGYIIQFTKHHLPEPLARRLMSAAMAEFAKSERAVYQEEMALVKAVAETT